MFRGIRAKALFAGLAGHSVLPFGAPASASFGLVLGMLGHAVGWPFPEGGAQSLANALARYLRDLGGEVVTGQTVHSLTELPPTRATLLDLTPRQVLRIAGDQMPASYQHALGRFRYGAGAFKVDWALNGPIPWHAPGCNQAATLHLGGTFAEIEQAEAAVMRGDHPERPYVLLAQHSRFDQTRAPLGLHTAWAYCHVPNGSSFDMTARIEDQIERFAPGFRKLIMARRVSRPADLEAWNANLVGGDVGGGALELAQVIARPTLSLRPYRTPLPGLYLCSASTPPGGGVHGMCGYHAAQAAIQDGF
jgi:phytoene dehydrogenase-like protein